MKKGFTLIEVIIILIILMVVVLFCSRLAAPVETRQVTGKVVKKYEIVEDGDTHFRVDVQTSLGIAVFRNDPQFGKKENFEVIQANLIEGETYVFEIVDYGAALPANILSISKSTKKAEFDY